MFESSDESDECGAGVSAEELFAGAFWLLGDAAPSSFPTAPVDDADAAADAGAAAVVCSDDDTSGEGDIVLDAGLRVCHHPYFNQLSVLHSSRCHGCCGAPCCPSNELGCAGYGVFIAEATAAFSRMKWA